MDGMRDPKKTMSNCLRSHLHHHHLEVFSGGAVGAPEQMTNLMKEGGLSCSKKLLYLFFFLRRKFRSLYSKIGGGCFAWRRRPRPKVVINKLRKKTHSKRESNGGSPSSFRNHTLSPLKYGFLRGSSPRKPVRFATFNAALFAMAPVLPKEDMFFESSPCTNQVINKFEDPIGVLQSYTKSPNSILKTSPLHNAAAASDYTKSKPRVSFNLPENEISLARSRLLSSAADKENACYDDSGVNVRRRSSVPVRSPLCFQVPPPAAAAEGKNSRDSLSSGKTILEVLKEVDADILALQDVKADEGNGMQPLADLACALGMNYVFAESWAPEYGNAVLSRWPIRRWKVQKIVNDDDIRNVLKATIDVPRMGELNIYCTQLDYLDENWRMKQINAILQSSDGPHILAGGLNSLNRSDYSSDRWIDIVKYFEEIGKPKPKDEVMSFLKGRGYDDAKDYAGECEPVVIIAKGQNVQGTCKYGTRVDYLLSSPDLPYKFVPGSYAVVSSKGTSDHHIAKVDIVKGNRNNLVQQQNLMHNQQNLKPKIIRITDPCSSRGIWQMMDR